MDLDNQKQAQYLDFQDSIGNLQLLSDQENLQKTNRDFAEWVTTRDATFKDRH